MTTSEKIRTSRESLGLTQEAAAKILGMSRRAYIDAEQGNRTRPLRLYEIAGILSIYAQLRESYPKRGK